MTLTERAKQIKEFSPLINGREKLETRDILNQELTLREFDMVQDKGCNQFAIVVFEEYPDNFVFAGGVLTSFIRDMTVGCQADGIRFKEELQKEGLKIRLVNRKAKTSGRTYTDVEVI